MDGGNSINKIIFLKERAAKKEAATLVASGPQGATPLCLVSLTWLLFHIMNSTDNDININRYLSRVTPSVAMTVINGGPDVQIELELRSFGFCGGRKTGEPGEKPS